MATPVLVKAYNVATSTVSEGSSVDRKAPTLPPASSYVFADILRHVDCPDFQSAIEGIAELCAKNRMSLADEYASHLPPLGEITAATTRPHLLRPGMHRPLTSVPEGSSGSSEGSRKSKKSSHTSTANRTSAVDGTVRRQIRIGSLGRTVDVRGMVCLAAGDVPLYRTKAWTGSNDSSQETVARLPCQRNSDAAASLQRLLVTTSREDSG